MVKDHPEGDLVEALRALRSLKGLPVEYMMTNYELSREALEQIVRDADPELWETIMPTVAEAWKKEGKAETLLRLLERRFDTVPEDAKGRVLAAPAEDLDAWVDAILSAFSLDDVFRNGSIH